MNERENKFRVWDSKYNHFIKEWAIDPDRLLNEQFDTQNGRFTFQQYTGLKDLNQREIFEGDIMCDNEGTKYEVKFQSGAFVKFAFGKNTTNLIESIVSLQAEIVGNIFETPDPLLGQ
jgi:ribosomal protein L27